MQEMQESSPVITGSVTLKRVLDAGAAVVALVLVAPLWAVLAALLWLTQGRPILYRQQRVGRYGASFTMFKFRTMIDGDHARVPDRPVARIAEETRITPLGRVLRRFALDELPQLLNVLHGEMSFIGPRPLPVDDLEHPGWLAYVSDDERARRLDWLARRHCVPPGLTGLWQITATPADDFDNWITRDLAYVEQHSLLLDLRILLATPWAVIRGRKLRRDVKLP